MTLSAPKKYYSRFLKGHEGKLHFAAHSHHFWPDVTRDAQVNYWDDCALLSDEKWNKVFSEVIPRSQKHIARILNLKQSEQIVFAPNTHELTSRLLSLFVGKKSLSVLTTGSEFHSLNRQLKRLEEIPEVKVTRVKVASSLVTELKSKLQAKPDLFFVSQVFFDSGIALSDADILELAKFKSPQTIMVVDGYHAFGAIPTNLAELEGKIFYLGGGYKYAQAGEGASFMVVPEGDWRPVYTGWFAEYDDLGKTPGAQIGYAPKGMAFMGATQDPSGLYRLNAVWDLFEKEGFGVPEIHCYVKALQQEFLRLFPPEFQALWQLTPVFSDLSWHGHFLTFHAASEELAKGCQEALKKAHIIIDRRGCRLRFGFGLYQDLADVQALTDTIKKISS